MVKLFATGSDEWNTSKIQQNTILKTVKSIRSHCPRNCPPITQSLAGRARDAGLTWAPDKRQLARRARPHSRQSSITLSAPTTTKLMTLIAQQRSRAALHCPRRLYAGGAMIFRRGERDARNRGIARNRSVRWGGSKFRGSDQNARHAEFAWVTAGPGGLR